LVPESDLEVGELRLLQVDEPVVIPVDTTVRFIVTATDVIHDFCHTLNIR
jgi:cytochrome c oxidase subunit 2